MPGSSESCCSSITTTTTTRTIRRREWREPAIRPKAVLAIDSRKIRPPLSLTMQNRKSYPRYDHNVYTSEIDSQFDERGPRSYTSTSSQHRSKYGDEAGNWSATLPRKFKQMERDDVDYYIAYHKPAVSSRRPIKVASRGVGHDPPSVSYVRQPPLVANHGASSTLGRRPTNQIHYRHVSSSRSPDPVWQTVLIRRPKSVAQSHPTSNRYRDDRTDKYVDDYDDSHSLASRTRWRLPRQEWASQSSLLSHRQHHSQYDTSPSRFYKCQHCDRMLKRRLRSSYKPKMLLVDRQTQTGEVAVIKIRVQPSSSTSSKGEQKKVDHRVKRIPVRVGHPESSSEVNSTAFSSIGAHKRGLQSSAPTSSYRSSSRQVDRWCRDQFSPEQDNLPSLDIHSLSLDSSSHLIDTDSQSLDDSEVDQFATQRTPRSMGSQSSGSTIRVKSPTSDATTHLVGRFPERSEVCQGEPIRSPVAAVSTIGNEVRGVRNLISRYTKLINSKEGK